VGAETRTVRLPPPPRTAPRSRSVAAVEVTGEFDVAPDTEVDPEPGALAPEEYELQSTRVSGSSFQEAPTRRSHMMTEALAAREASMARARRLPVRDARLPGSGPRVTTGPEVDFFEEKTTRVRPGAPRPAPSRAVAARPVPPPLPGPPPPPPRPQRLALKPPPFAPASPRPTAPVFRTTELPPLEPPWPVQRPPRRERRRRPSGVLVIVGVVAATFGIELCRVFLEAALRRPRPAALTTPTPSQRPAIVVPLPPGR
jgi:hypothetical protein